MAASIIYKPGTEMGPCVENCGHVDCNELKRMAESLCAKCGEIIGYDRRFYILEGGKWGSVYAHAVCVEQEKK